MFEGSHRYRMLHIFKDIEWNDGMVCFIFYLVVEIAV